ncbi:MAG: Yip1 family protein [bacterium]|nr:Yip1 family protein [bacterium]
MIEDISTEQLNPWISIWRKPRETMRAILQRTYSPILPIILVSLAGFGTTIARASMKNAGDVLSLPVIFLIAIPGGIVAGLLQLYVGSSVLKWTGILLGGKASLKQIRLAVAWASIPFIWVLLLLLPKLLLFGDELFASTMILVESSTTLSLLLTGFTIIEIVVAIWGIIVFWKCLGEVQGFSAWKALGNSALAFALISFFVFILAVLIFIGNMLF